MQPAPLSSAAMMEPSTSGRRSLRRLPFALGLPVPLLLLALGVHVVGRIAAFCGPHKVDSLVYAVSAYRLWQPAATVNALVPDKPPGQAILTGWAYHVFPGAPSRLTLVPVEFCFLLAAYAVFWRLGVRLFGGRVAAALTLLVVIAFNAYNVLDTTTDGFNLNENYLALPMWLAVAAHLCSDDPLRRGLLRGLGLGLALTIKQTAVGLAVVMILHGLIRCRRMENPRSAVISAVSTAAVLGLLGMVLMLFLAWRGWLGIYLPGLTELSKERIGSMRFRWPEDYKLNPAAFFAWWVALGVLASFWPRRPRGSAHVVADRCGLVSFACLWFAAEALVLWSLQIPSTHYYQQIVAPLALLAGAGWLALQGRLRRLATSKRVNANCWVAVTTAVLALIAAAPILAAGSKLLPTFDPQAEARLFRDFAEAWQPAATHQPRESQS